MKRILLHICITLICLACCVNMVRFTYEQFQSSTSIFFKISACASLCGWLAICYMELMKWCVTNYVIKVTKKICKK